MAETEKHGTTQYYLLFLVLAALMVTTVCLSFVPLGEWNLILALLIAATQGSLLTLFFMHLRGSDQLTWLAAGASLFWLAILFVFTLTDYLTRHYAVL